MRVILLIQTILLCSCSGLVKSVRKPSGFKKTEYQRAVVNSTGDISEVQVVNHSGGSSALGGSFFSNDSPTSFRTIFMDRKTISDRWSTPSVFKENTMDLTVNPSLATSNAGFYRVVFSPKLDFSEGTLSFSSRSIDGEWTKWKVIIRTIGSVPDKPWIAVNKLSGRIDMTYTELFRRTGKLKGFCSKIMTSHSIDKGNNWSESLVVHPSQESFLNCMGKQGDYDRPIGSFLLTDKFGTYLSWASYENGPVYFAKLAGDGLTWNKTKISESTGLGRYPGVTGIASDPLKDTKVLYWYDPHYQFGNIQFTALIGKTAEWTKPLVLSDRGAQLVMKMKGGRAYMAFQEANLPVEISDLDKLDEVKVKFEVLDLMANNTKLFSESLAGVSISPKGKSWFSKRILAGGYQSLNLLKNRSAELHTLEYKKDGGWSLSRYLFNFN